MTPGFASSSSVTDDTGLFRSFMSFVHRIHIGHFECDGNAVRFSNTPDNPILKPIVARPLEMAVVSSLAQEIIGQGVDCPPFPDAWNLWLEEGYLTGNRYSLSPDALRFIARLVEATDSDLVDFNARSIIEITDVRS